jgi:hypothetical protein
MPGSVTTAAAGEDDAFAGCYNCGGTQMRRMCGMPQMGCSLCRTYGDGRGRLLKRYRQESVVIGDLRYTPPPWQCLWCHDTQVCERSVWIDRIVANGCSFRGVYMPVASVPCFQCTDRAVSDAALEGKRVEWTRIYAAFATDAEALAHARQEYSARILTRAPLREWQPCTRISAVAPIPAPVPAPAVPLHEAMFRALGDMTRGFFEAIVPK